MVHVVELSSRLDSRAAYRLADDLRGLRGQPLVLDAASVRSIGALGIEVILSAAALWRADGVAVGLAGPSDAFTATCAQLGLDPLAPWQAAATRHGTDAA